MADNTSTDTNSTVSATDLERIDLLDNLDIFDYYRNNPKESKRADANGFIIHNFVTKIPSNTVLVCRDFFSGDFFKVKRSDATFKFLSRNVRFQLLRTNVQLVNFKPRSDYETIDGYTVPVGNFLINVKLVDSLKYTEEDYNKSRDQKVLHKLYLLVDGLIEAYIKSQSFDELVMAFTNRSLKVPRQNPGPTDINLDPQGKLQDFENENGVRVVDILWQNLRQPVKLKKLAEARANEDVRAVQRATEQRDAQVEADNARTVGQAQADVLRAKGVASAATVNDYMAAGMNSEDAAKVAMMQNIPEGTNPFISIGTGSNNSNNNDFFAQMMAFQQWQQQNMGMGNSQGAQQQNGQGMANSNGQFMNRGVPNNVRILEEIDRIFTSDIRSGLSEDKIQKLAEFSNTYSSDANAIATVNSSDEEFERVCQYIFGHSLNNSNTRGRSRR